MLGIQNVFALFTRRMVQGRLAELDGRAQSRTGVWVFEKETFVTQRILDVLLGTETAGFSEAGRGSAQADSCAVQRVRLSC